MKMKKGLVTLLIVALMIALVGCNSNETTENGEGQGKNTDKRTLTVATSADFPPFETIDTKGEIVGFDIDLIKEIGKELDAEIAFKNMEFNGIIAAIQTGKADLAISGLSVDKERVKKVNFSDSYYETSQTIVVKKDTIGLATMDDVKGLTVGSQLGSSSDDVISTFDGIEVKKYNKVTDAIQDLKNGRIEAVIVEDSIAEAFVQKNDELEIVIPEGLNTEDQPFAIAIPKEDEKLLKEVNTALQAIKDSGKYDELVAKWFTFE